MFIQLLTTVGARLVRTEQLVRMQLIITHVLVLTVTLVITVKKVYNIMYTQLDNYIISYTNVMLIKMSVL